MTQAKKTKSTRCIGCDVPLPKGHTEFCSRRCRYDSFPRRFLGRVNSSAGAGACWPWTGHCDSNGYGKILVRGRQEHAHRFALTLASGKAPRGKPFALHSCDNPPCCNPEHLRWGSPAENSADAVKRNRTLKLLSNPKARDLTGTVFGRLTVLAVADTRRSRIFWKCLCTCGVETLAHTSDLLRGQKKSCGCWKAEIARNRMLARAEAGRASRRRVEEGAA